MTFIHHVAGRTLWLVLGGLVGAFVWVHAGDTSSALEGWLQSGKQEAQTASKYRWDVRVLSGQVATHLHHEARLAEDTTRLRVARDTALAAAVRLAQSVDSLHRAPLTAAVRRVGEACGEQLNTCEQRVGAAWGAFETEHTLRLLATTRVAHADSIIGRGLTVTDCRFLLFRCPSRTHVAEGAFLVGLVTALVVAH